MTQEFYTPANSVFVTHEVKKSLFHVHAAAAGSRELAMNLLAQAQQRYPDARHHCWAYVLQRGRSAASSDDGEPSGTAGKPILNVLIHKNISDVMVVVSRYFGGVKLGAGGLVRAYSAAAQLAVEDLELVVQEARCELELCCDFATEQYLRHWMQVNNAQLLDCQYTDKVRITVNMKESSVAACRAFCEANGLAEPRLL